MESRVFGKCVKRDKRYNKNGTDLFGGGLLALAYYEVFTLSTVAY